MTIEGKCDGTWYCTKCLEDQEGCPFDMFDKSTGRSMCKKCKVKEKQNERKGINV